MNVHFRAPSYAGSVLQRVFRGIREWCGDAAYERYAESYAKHSCGCELLTRQEFYLSQLQKKYSQVNRCC
jgi:uncharacterized short protein YbdD (DUF466 family)